MWVGKIFPFATLAFFVVAKCVGVEQKENNNDV